MTYGRGNVREPQPGIDSVGQEAAEKRGYFYRTIEEQIDRFAATAGPEDSVADLADWVGARLRAKAKAIWSQHGTAELLQQMREDLSATVRGTRNGSRTGPARTPLHVRSRAGRALGPKDPDKVAKIGKMLGSGMSPMEIAQEFQVSPDAIRQMMRRHGLSGNGYSPGRRARNLNPDSKVFGPRDPKKIERVRLWAAKGWHADDIAKKLGVTSGGVRWLARKYNIPMNQKDTSGNLIDSVGRRIVRHKPYVHWTQKPENKARVKERLEKMHAARKSQAQKEAT